MGRRKVEEREHVPAFTVFACKAVHVFLWFFHFFLISLASIEIGFFLDRLQELLAVHCLHLSRLLAEIAATAYILATVDCSFSCGSHETYGTRNPELAQN